MQQIPESVDGLPCLSGFEQLIDQARSARASATPRPDLTSVRSGFAIALHMHQPLIPAGPGDLQQAAVISNLQHMLEHPEVKDAHNAAPFLECYRRMADFIPQLVAEGKSPRVMLDYSGCLLYGLRKLGADHVIDALKTLTEERYSSHVEWLGTAWGHAVAPSTPPQDFRLHVRAWQHQFGAMFGLDALARVRGFSPPEMALPNHPDVFYELVKTLLDCGYEWLLVQEHTVETVDEGKRLSQAHLPHRLIARNSRGESVSITAIIKTQGSDTKLIGQMQPFYEAKNLSRVRLADVDVPPLVTQISDGENGGVMMNEFPGAYFRAVAESSGSQTPAMNVSEYLEYLRQLGVNTQDFSPIQPAGQQRIWARFIQAAGPEELAKTLELLRKEDSNFHVDGGSWTADLSWVRGYEGLLAPMAEASRQFSLQCSTGRATDGACREALFYLMLAQTSCFRYWGEGEWTGYGKEFCRRVKAAIDSQA